MTVYKLRTDDGIAYVSANLVQAAAPIHVYFGDDPFYDLRGEPSDDEGIHWDHTPYQTADCQHYEDRLASLIATHCELGEVYSVEVVEPPPDEDA